ncbi:SDR family NAD(P)-dependent oxidoreductase [Gordonia terrae]|uniref:KR domain-containing protein n=2 Tax=Gordonia terrae TaxID=2055 RepID=A0AAD0K4K0_9ACTN|nr:SDR family NAD(P)-dependent oxidoreductase [Gordonia terrae]VTR09618.1 3-oxoacyl-ACP reductase [Clostridioides difficile]ANY22229.1 short-chain dehydrogenase [Gordonia terrae]AWO82968.1 KR domain-containing protein [Gordonia terrae]VTS30111.1 Putative short-chain type dehydrogenase/reductase Rv0148 [Gordonia terrae]GAB46302.1 putative oxidoreductase [Gordonia terrae NBRC 100016]
MQELRYDDRCVIITGAGRGIGREYALLLAARGASVVVGDLGARTDGSGLDGDDPAATVAAEITAAGGRAVACRADVSHEQGAKALVEAAMDSFGRIDGVINNAGIVRTADFRDVPDEEHQRHLDVHYFGSLRLCRAAWPHLIASGTGRVVNTVSGAMLGNPMMTHYGSSKAAVFGLTRSLAVEGKSAGIAVNAIAPGAGTRMAEAATDSLSPEVVAHIRNNLRAEFVAPMGAYLVHPSATVTGEVFTVAGGAVRRLALLDTVGINDPNLNVETIATQFDDVMAITSDAVPHVLHLDA